jgi:hypothetical protein
MSDKPSIFISAPAGTKTGVLRTILTQCGASVVDAFDFAPGESLSETLTSKISKADGVVIVYSEASPNVAFEMGISVASKKPTFILVEPTISVPAFVQSFLHLRSTLKDTDVLRASLVRFVEETKKKRHRHTMPVKRRDESKKIQSVASFLDVIRENRKTVSPLQIESAVMEILKNSGLQVEGQMSGRDAGVDCVVWSDQLRQTMGNPILIEVKAGNVDSGRLNDAEKQLGRYLQVAGAHYGIVLYLDRSGRRFGHNPASPNILRFDLEDFAQSLQSSSFEEVLLAERNRIVHGGQE